MGQELADRAIWGPAEVADAARRIRSWTEGQGDATAPRLTPPNRRAEALDDWLEALVSGVGVGVRAVVDWAVEQAGRRRLRRQLQDLALEPAVCDLRPTSDRPDELLPCLRRAYRRWEPATNADLGRRIEEGLDSRAPTFALNLRGLLAEHVKVCRRCTRWRSTASGHEVAAALDDACPARAVADLWAGGVDWRRLARGAPGEALPEVFTRPTTRVRDLLPTKGDSEAVNREVHRFDRELGTLRPEEARDPAGPRVISRLFVVHKAVISYAWLPDGDGDGGEGWAEVARKDKPRMCLNARPVCNKGFAHASFVYPDVAQCLEHLTPGGWLWTLDLADFYTSLPVHPEARRLCTTASRPWNDARFRIYHYTGVAFGLAEAPALASTVSAIMREAAGADAVYIDDAVGAAESEVDGARQLARMMEVVAAAGLRLKPAKITWPGREVRLLGWLVQITADEVRLSLPQDKWAQAASEVRALARAWRAGRAVDVDLVRSVAGRVDHIAQVLQPHLRGTPRAWIRVASDGAWGNEEHLWGREAAVRLTLWETALRADPSRSWRSRRCGAVVWRLFCDASDEGAGAWAQGVEVPAWAVRFDEASGAPAMALRAASSTLRELVAIRIAAEALAGVAGHLPTWGPDTILVVTSDSASALFCLSRGSSTCPDATAQVRRILQALMRPEAPRWVPNHVPRERNARADALSHPPSLQARLRDVCRDGQGGVGRVCTGRIAGVHGEVCWDADAGTAGACAGDGSAGVGGPLVGARTRLEG